MKRLFTLYITLLTGLPLVGTPVFGQSKPPLTKRDEDNIEYYTRSRLTLLNQLMNQLTDKDIDGRAVEYIISNSYQPGESQVFYNDLITIEDDIDPEHTSAVKTEDVTIEKYLTDLSLFYAKSDQSNTIVFSNYRFLRARQEKDFVLKKCYFTSTFRGKTKTDKSYLPTNRVVEMRAERINNKWQVRIIRLGFAQPGEDRQSLSQKDASTAPGSTPGTEVAKVTVPENLSISGPDVAYQKTGGGMETTLKFNKDWTQVVQSGSVDIPVGWYKRQGKLPAYLRVKGDQLDEQTKIEFQNNNNRFIFYQGLNYVGYDRVIQRPTVVTTRPSATTVSSVPTPTTTVPSSQTTVVATLPPAAKPATLNESDRTSTQPASTTAQVSKVQQKSAMPVPSPPGSGSADAAPAVVPEKTNPITTPDYKNPVTPATPALTQSLLAEAKARKARYRRAGWLQIVGSVAGLAGAYLAYSAIRKDYDSYKARVDQLNSSYNAWHDLARSPTGSALEPMSISGYGKPGVYGAYAGGSISLVLVINGIRSLTKAGRIKLKADKK